MTNPTQQPVAGTAPLSVVMAVHDQADALRRNLPLLLDIHYEPGYEVIVVDIASTDDTADVLTQLKHAHPFRLCAGMSAYRLQSSPLLSA